MKRLQNRDGNFYVATSERDWPTAIKRMQAAVERKHEALAAWEREHRPDGYPGGDYWKAYETFKRTMPIDYPMPLGHCMFKDPSGYECVEVEP